MGLFGLFKKRPPDIRTLGKWLWNNDVALLDQTLQNATVSLFKELVESGIIRVQGGSTLLSDHDVDMIAGHVANLLDGGYLLQGYQPKISEKRLLSIATAARDLSLQGEYPDLSVLSITTGTLLAIRAWYARRFDECISVATHVVSIATKTSGAEAYRVRGFGRFALGDYEAALGDMVEAQRRQPGLVGINEPLGALRRLTGAPQGRDKDHEPAGLAMNRLALRTFSTILHLGAASARATTPANEVLDFARMAHLVDEILESTALESRQLQMGAVIDFAKCAMSANLALTKYLLVKDRPGQGSIPSEQEIRDAFAACMLFLHGTNAINANIDPRFTSAVQELQREVDSLFAWLDASKFDLSPSIEAEDLFDRKLAEYESAEIGTPTSWEPYSDLPIESIPPREALLAAVDRYWLAFADLRDVYHRNIKRNPNDRARAPQGFPGNSDGFLLFDPNAQLLRFSEIPRLLQMPVEEIRATLPPVKLALLVYEDQVPPSNTSESAAAPATNSEYWLPFFCRLTILGTDCTIFEFRDGRYLIKEEYPPFVGQLVIQERFTNALWLNVESTALLRRLHQRCLERRRTGTRMAADEAYALIRGCTKAIFAERLQKWKEMDWPSQS